MSEKMERLKAILAETVALNQVVGLLNWDRETYMPEGAAQARGHQLGVIAKLQHEMFTSEEVGRLLEDLAAETADLDPDSDDARLVKVTRRDYDQYSRVPTSLVQELQQGTAEGIPAWHHAKEAQDFKLFVPALKRNNELSQQLAEALGYEERPYDAFVNIFEPGMTTTQLETIFQELKETILPLVREIVKRQDAVDDSFLFQRFEPQQQLDFSMGIAKQYGYDNSRGRLDLTAHPFCQSMSRDDVRITTRVLPEFLNACLFAVLHETGHALYEQGVSPDLAFTPLSSGTSAGVHESQSRLWENLVGRSRAFQDYLFPRLQEAYPQQLGNVDVERFYRAVNKVYPSYIRVEADEVTYNLHVLLRFELENAMLEGRIDIDTLDEAWNDKMQEYLGIVPSNAVEGVLQDIHWAWGQGYSFPGYTVGNVVGAQFFAQARKDMPDLDEQISRGEFSNLLGWLQTNIYRHGRKFDANELAQRITGEPVNTRAWREYVTRKFPAIYGF
ncbi:MAG TPA: carboxypeptidase M32 [Chloroflexia bacterium]|nr:carboxypeptidase M32 [Chloroflexia bacterium]